MMRSVGARETWAPRRVVAAAVAALCLAAQLAIVAHAGLVEHVRCPLHGDLVHPGSNHEHHEHRSPGDAPSAVPVDEHHAGEHEHCAVLAHRREAPPAVAPLDVASGELGWLGPPALRSVVRAAPVALFRLAPKNSPPVA
jgi:hypothetical protein